MGLLFNNKMKKDPEKYCHRCGKEFGVSKIMSWFTTEMLCDECRKKDSMLRDTFPNRARDYEGCGFLPLAIDEKK